MKDRIYQLRKKLDLSQEQFASRLGLSRNFMGLVEKGERNISDRTISDICRIFRVNEEWLRTGSGEMEAPANREGQIADLVLSLAKSPDDSFTIKMAELLPQLSEKQIEALYNLAVMLEKKEDLP